MFKDTDGVRSLSTLVSETHAFVDLFLTNDLFRYKCIKYKLKTYQMTSVKHKCMMPLLNV